MHQQCIEVPRNASQCLQFAHKGQDTIFGKTIFGRLMGHFRGQNGHSRRLSELEMLQKCLKMLKMSENATKIIAKVRRSLFMFAHFYWYLMIFNDF
jgi:hypothetical protein